MKKNQKSIIKFLTLMFLGLFFSQITLADELYLMPRDSKLAINSLLKHIKEAKKEIRIAIYSFTNREISKALRDAAKKNVAIYIIYDKESNEDTDKSTIGYLAKLQNIEVCTLSGTFSKNGKYVGKMHSKMVVIDDNFLILGSANWSKSAFENNYETLLITENKDFIAKSQKELNRMWNICDKY